MTRFTKEQLQTFRGVAVPDLVPASSGPGSAAVRLLFVGINPGLWTAAVQTHFAHPGNRFYPALLEAGILSHRIDPAAGMTDDDRAEVRARGIAITNLVERATARADELTAEELRAGGERLRATVRRLRPSVVAVLGITAYRAAFGVRGAAVGRQEHDLEGAQLWVLPNPSGLNAHETVGSLALAYAEAARAAGVLPPTSPTG